MEAAPAAPLVMAEPDLLLELMIVALDAPAQLGEIDQVGKGHVLGQGGEPILDRLRLAFGPLDQQPFLVPRLGKLLVAVGAPAPWQSARRASRPRPRAR